MLIINAGPFTMRSLLKLEVQPEAPRNACAYGISHAKLLRLEAALVAS
jgi:hypothetical protein